MQTRSSGVHGCDGEVNWREPAMPDRGATHTPRCVAKAARASATGRSPCWRARDQPADERGAPEPATSVSCAREDQGAFRRRFHLRRITPTLLLPAPGDRALERRRTKKEVG